MTKKNLSIIYDVTQKCPWNCRICCMGASNDDSCRRNELTQKQKLDVVRQIEELCKNGYNARIDLSGGEIFTDIEHHMELVKALSDALGKEKVGISCSGYGIDKKLADFLAQNVHDVEMTMDVVANRYYKLRPLGYSKTAAKAVLLLKNAGCKVGLQTVATTYNNNYKDTSDVFKWACENGVDNWSILRFFPSGRGADYPEAAMNDAECEAYVHMVSNMAKCSNSAFKPQVDFHYLMPGHSKYTHVCRCVRHSIGILPNGDVVSCFWALDSNTGVIEPKFLLGNVKDKSLREILNGEKARYWSDCEHCCELSNQSSEASERRGEDDVLSA